MESLTTTIPADNGSEAPSQPSRFKKIRPWLVLSILVSGSVIWWLTSRSPSADEVPASQPIPVQIKPVQASVVESSSEFVGALEARKRVVVRPKVTGYISQIRVGPGESVKAGTEILQLDPDRRRAELSGAISDIEAARASRNTAQAQLLEAEANRASVASEVALQTKELERMRVLVTQGALPQQDLDRTLNSRDTALAQLKAADRRIRATQAAVRETTAAFQRSQSDAVAVREDLRDYQILAPIDGVVGDLPLKVGDYVNIGDQLSTLTQNQVLELRLSIPVEREKNLQRGTTVELRLQPGSKPLTTGQISFIAPRVDGNAQSILAKASFLNPGGRLRDEQFVRAKVIWSQRPGLLVPTRAVSFVGGQPFVFVVQEDDKQQIVEQRPIKVGEIQGNSYPVISGLKRHDLIVTSGILKLSDGTPIVDEAKGTANE